MSALHVSAGQLADSCHSSYRQGAVYWALQWNQSPCRINDTTYQRKFCECTREPGEVRADTHTSVTEICLPGSLSCVSTNAMCASPCAWNAFSCILTMLSTLLLLTSFVKSRCLNLDQAAREMPWFFQVCKTRNLSLSWEWPVQHKQRSDTFMYFCCLSPTYLSLSLPMDNSYSYIGRLFISRSLMPSTPGLI